jgi:hypothetical protein
LWQKLNTNWLINVIDLHNLPKYHEDVIVVAHYHLCHCWRLLYLYVILVVVQMRFVFNLLQFINWGQLPLFHVSWSIVRFFNVSNLNYQSQESSLFNLALNHKYHIAIATHKNSIFNSTIRKFLKESILSHQSHDFMLANLS